MTKQLLIDRYRRIKRNGVNNAILAQTMISRVLPDIAQYIDKRFEFIKEKRNPLLKSIEDLKNLFLQNNSLTDLSKQQYDDYSDEDDTDPIFLDEKRLEEVIAQRKKEEEASEENSIFE